MGKFVGILVGLTFFLGGFPAQASVDEMVTDALNQVGGKFGKIPESIKTVAVYAVTPDTGGQVNVESLSDRLVGVLLKSERFQVIDRKSLKNLLEEQALSMTGVVDETQMVKAGKLIGVQGFFYGSVDVREDSVVLSLKLVDVQTSAIVWSKEIIGEAASAARVGVAWGVAGAPFTARYTAEQTCPPFAANMFPPTDKDGMGVSLMDLTVSYRQGLKGWKWGQFGADIAFAYYLAPSGIKFEDDSQYADWEGVQNRWGWYVEYEAVRLSLRPKLYFLTKGMFGWENDWLNPYVGATVDLNLFKHYARVFRTENAVPFTDYGDESGTDSTMIVTFGPLAGVEVNFTKSLSLYAEAMFIPETVGDVGGPEPINFVLLDTEPGLSGLAWNAGVKYYFNLFGGAKK